MTIVFPKRRKYSFLFPFEREFLMVIFFFSIYQLSFSQTNIVFDDFPTHVQLIQRDSTNHALVKVFGKVYSENQTDVALIVLKNKEPFYYKKQKLQFTSANQQISSADFSFSPLIKAELSEYDFKFYSFVNNDSTLIKEANEVVCGENIIIYGQSNALADAIDELPRFKDEFRFGRSTFSFFDTNEFIWVSTKSWNYWSAGLIGLEIQRQLIDKFQIPIGIINGSVGNKSIDELSIRDEKNHDNTSTIYGRLLRRAKIFKIDKNVRIIIWRQGESEALNPNYKDDYEQKFDNLRNQLYEDFPSIKKIYTFQNNIYFGNNTLAGNLREFQRNIKKKYEDCEVLSTIGNPSFDGLHYKLEGYQQNGLEVSRLIARDFLGSKDTLEIDAPNIKEAFLNDKNDSIVLVFEKNQRMLFPSEKTKTSTSHPSINAKDYFFLDGQSSEIETGKGTENYITLKLKNPRQAKTISFAPDNYSGDFIAVLPGIIPFSNSRGVAALTFKDVKLTTTKDLIISSLSAIKDSISNKIILSWEKQSYFNYTYVIEKSQVANNDFKEIGQTNQSSFVDTDVFEGIKYYYRIKIIGVDEQSPYSNVIEIENSASLKNQILVFPNPIFKNEQLNIVSFFEKPIKQAKILDAFARKIKLIETNNKIISFPINDLNPGLYIIEAILEDNTKLIKKFVVQ